MYFNTKQVSRRHTIKRDLISFPVRVYLGSVFKYRVRLAGRLAQLVERRTREHNVSGHYRCGFVSPAGQLKSLIVSRMRR